MTLTSTGLTLADLFPPADLAAAVEAGHVTRKQHPGLPLSILTYTRECQYGHIWTPVTMQCRGLVADDVTGLVVALPFPKIFVTAMHGVHDFAPPLPAEPFEIFEKADGSLIILFHYDGQWHAASKGSFISDQAQWAQQLIDAADLSQLDPGLTYLAEAIYPGNRIVVDYGQREELMLLAAYRPADGTEELLSSIAPHWAPIGPVIRSWGLSSDVTELEQLALASTTLGGATVGGTEEEGYVIRYASGARAKIKMADYLRIHRLVTRVTPREIWRYVGAEKFPDLPLKSLAHILGTSTEEAAALRGIDGSPLEALLQQVPDEFDQFVRSARASLDEGFEKAVAAAQEEFSGILSFALAGHPIAVGLCQCGCGGTAPIATGGSREYPSGTPTKYIPRHTVCQIPVSYDVATGCWLNAGPIASNGYGLKRGTTMHRFVYRLTKGPVVDGYDLDHLCRVRHCFSPNHLEEVTRMENSRRGAKAMLSPADVATIREAHGSGSNPSQIARSMNLHRNTVDGVLRGDTWGDDSGAVISKPLSSDFRRRFALLSATSPRRGLLFKMLDSASIGPEIWRSLKPSASDPFKNDEDN